MDPELAAWEVQRDYAELALSSGNAPEALRLSEELLAVAGVVEVPELGRSVRTVHALALEASGDLEGAILELERIVAEEPYDEAWIRTVIALSRCYRDAGDLNRAIDVGERVREPIRELGLAGVSEAIRLTVTIGAAYFHRGDVVYAVQLCRGAIEDAERSGATEGLAAAYWNLASMEGRRGKTEDALPMARTALEMFEQGEDARNLARLRSLVVHMQLRLPSPDLDAVISELHQAQRELEWSSASPYDRAGNLTALAEAHLLRGELSVADDAITQALVLVDGKAPWDEAVALILRGRIAFAGGDLDGALAAYRDAIGRLTGIGADRRAGEAWFEVGAALERLGSTAEAMAAYRSAAVSAGIAMRPEIHPAHLGEDRAQQ